MNIIVDEPPGDCTEAINGALGFERRQEAAKTIESYSRRYELTLIVNGGGSVWLFVA